MRTLALMLAFAVSVPAPAVADVRGPSSSAPTCTQDHPAIGPLLAQGREAGWRLTHLTGPQAARALNIYKLAPEADGLPPEPLGSLDIGGAWIGTHDEPDRPPILLFYDRRNDCVVGEMLVVPNPHYVDYIMNGGEL